MTPEQAQPQDEEEAEKDYETEKEREGGKGGGNEGGQAGGLDDEDLTREQQSLATAGRPASTPGDAATVATATATAAADLATPTDRSLYPWGEGQEEEDEDATLNGAGGRAQGVPSKAEALALPDGEFLSGCRLMLVGFASEALLPLSLLVRKGCGIR